jgi:O-acetyl-ADP-ribose deacetylase (regulator of RNase III)
MEVMKAWRNIVPTKVSTLPSGAKFVVSSGSVVFFAGDAIVNAANMGCLGGGGVDGAISIAGGQQLMLARKALPVVAMKALREVRCETGDAKITIGGNLKAKWCIHAVGPNYQLRLANGSTLASCDELLASAYRRAMAVARENGVQTVAFCLLSAGVYRGPRTLQAVIDIAVRSVAESDYEGLQEVHLCAFSEQESVCLHNALKKVRHSWAGWVGCTPMSQCRLIDVRPTAVATAPAFAPFCGPVPP